MRVFLAVMVAVVVATGTAQAQTPDNFTVSAVLEGGQVVPTKVLTGAFGIAVVTVDVPAKSFTWNIDVFNLASGTSNAHFHVGSTGVDGPPLVDIPFGPNLPNDYRLSGNASALNAPRPDLGIRTVDDFIQAMVGGQIYVNIHSNQFPGGEIRGQLVLRP